MSKTVSLITVYNNEQLVEEMKSSAALQEGVDIEYIMLDNRGRKYKSAAEALNAGVDMAKGEVLVFLHQDIEFVSANTLEYIYDYATANKNAVFGAAGVTQRTAPDSEVFILSSMYAGPDKQKYSDMNESKTAFTLDECLIACHSSCMEKLRFDEEICDGWHLYGADLCLQALAFANFSVQVVPLDCWHKSNGCADKSYFMCQSRLAKKYRKYFKIINTTNGYSYTNPLKRTIQNLYRKIRY